MTADTVGGRGLPFGRPLALACGLAVLLGALVRFPGLGPFTTERLPSAVAGTLAAGLAALVCGRLAGLVAAGWGGLFVALSPIHAIESRVPGTSTLLVLLVLLALLLVLELESRPRTTLGVSAGAILVILGACGAAAFVVDSGPVPDDMPPTTLSSVLRCSGASFTRVAGIEYHLVVSHARGVLPVTLLFVALMGLGASRLSPRPRAALVAGALAPFALAALLALTGGRVQPMQATRLLAALPFTAALTAVGLASLRGVAAWAAGAAVAGVLALGLVLTFAG